MLKLVRIEYSAISLRVSSPQLIIFSKTGIREIGPWLKYPQPSYMCPWAKLLEYFIHEMGWFLSFLITLKCLNLYENDSPDPCMTDGVTELSLNLFFFFFLRAGVLLCCPGQSQTAGLKWSSCFSPQSRWYYRRAPPHPTLACILICLMFCLIHTFLTSM